MTRDELYLEIRGLVDEVHTTVEATEALPPETRERFTEMARQAAFLQADDVAEALHAVSNGDAAFRDLFALRELVVSPGPSPTNKRVEGVDIDLESDLDELLLLAARETQIVVEGTGRGEAVFFVRFDGVENASTLVDWVEERVPVVAHVQDEMRGRVSFLVLCDAQTNPAESWHDSPVATAVVHVVPSRDVVVPRASLGYASAIDQIPVTIDSRDIELLGLYAAEISGEDGETSPVQALVSVIERSLSVSVPAMLNGVKRRLGACSSEFGVEITLRAQHDPGRLSVGIGALAEELVAAAVCAVSRVAQTPIEMVLAVSIDSNGRALAVRVEKGKENLDLLRSSPAVDELRSVAERVASVVNSKVDVLPAGATGEIVRMELGASPRLMSVARARSGDRVVAIPAAPIELTFEITVNEAATDPYGGHLVRSLGRLVRLVDEKGEPYRGARPVGRKVVIYRTLAGTVGIVVDELQGHDLVVRHADDSREVYLSSDGTRVPLLNLY